MNAYDQCPFIYRFCCKRIQGLFYLGNSLLGECSFREGSKLWEVDMDGWPVGQGLIHKYKALKGQSLQAIHRFEGQT